MNGRIEFKIFQVARWIFLLVSLIFFVFYISSGHIVLSLPVWLSFLILAVGFAVFTFIPLPGSTAPGPLWREKNLDRWYPRSLEEILERKGDSAKEKTFVPVSRRAISPVPVIPLILLVVVILMAMPGSLSREEWIVNERIKLEEIYKLAEQKLLAIEDMMEEMEHESAKLLEEYISGSRSSQQRAVLLERLDSLAVGRESEFTPLGEIGVQIFSPNGVRIAWGGSPVYREKVVFRDSEVREFTERSSLYTLFVRIAPLSNGYRVVVDVPLAVNYRINNQYLKSVSFSEILSEELGKEVQFNFSMGEHDGEMGLDLRRELDQKGPRMIFRPGEGMLVYGYAVGANGLPISRIRVSGEPYDSVVEESRLWRKDLAGILIVLIMAVIAFWIYRKYGKHYYESKGRLRNFINRIIIFLFFLILMRLMLLRLDLPASLISGSIFGIANFAAGMPGDIARTAGDLLVTAIFSLALVFGIVKTFRNYYPGVISGKLAMDHRLRPAILLIKTVMVFAVLAATLLLVRSVVNLVVSNSTFRLIGFEADLSSLIVLVLHLCILYIVAAVFIGSIFLCRMLFVWKEGNIGEFLIISVLVAAVITAVMLGMGYHWTMLVGVAGLLTFSCRIFPFLKKDDMTSIIFSSFFLVLLGTVVIFGVSSVKYREFRENVLLEKVQDFNNPDDIWYVSLLPEECGEISRNREIISRVKSGEKSAAFEIWAQSSLSENYLSCVVDVYNEKGEHFSRFQAGMPFNFPLSDSVRLEEDRNPYVERLKMDTPGGLYYYAKGIIPMRTFAGVPVGKVELVIPYFSGDLEVLARATRRTPEILHNIGKGEVAPRVDEPEDLLVAKVENGRVVDSSNQLLEIGRRFRNIGGELFALQLGKDRYRCVIREKSDGEGYLVGFRMAGVAERFIQWAMLVSVYSVLAFLSLAVLILMGYLPIMKSIIPSVSFGPGGIGFRQKILLSFLAVSVLPVVLIAGFSGDFIKDRFGEENREVSLRGLHTANKLMKQTIISEAESFAGSQYLSDILVGREAKVRDVSIYRGVKITLFDSSGNLLLDEGFSDFRDEEIERLTEKGNLRRVLLSYEPSRLFGGTVISLSGEEGLEGYLFFRRQLDDNFIERISDVVGQDINIYYNGILRCSSERELFEGGFLNPLLDPALFSAIALRGSDIFFTSETLGEYSYYVASRPIETIRGEEYGVLSVPTLFQPALASREIKRVYTFILGLLAILFAVSVIMGFLLAEKIFKPVAELRDGTRKIIKGDLGFHIESVAADEIGELVDSFNTMTGELNRARQNLIERQRYLSTVLNNVAAGVIAADSAGVITTLNPSGERILGISSEEIEGRKYWEIDKSEIAPVLDLFSGREAGGEEKELVISSGDERRTLKAVLADLKEGEDRLGTVIVFDDLTELIRTKKLAAWVEMARQIAHEVKNPLTPMKLSVQYMKRAYDEKRKEFSEVFESGVETVLQQIEILRAIVSEFSSFGKVSRLKMEQVELDPFIRDFISAYQGEEDIEIDYGGGEGVSVFVDREALRKIMVNIMENSLEAIRGEGRIEVGYRREGDFVEIKFLDSGEGIPPDVEEKLFEPYFSTKTNGTGLGLAISQNLAREMGGEIRIGNRKDRSGVEAVVVVPWFND